MSDATQFSEAAIAAKRLESLMDQAELVEKILSDGIDQMGILMRMAARMEGGTFPSDLNETRDAMAKMMNSIYGTRLEWMAAMRGNDGLNKEEAGEHERFVG